MKADEENEYTISCPLCEVGILEYEALDNPKAMGTDGKGSPKTHIWVCNECPGILMEWYNSRDTEAIAKRLG